MNSFSTLKHKKCSVSSFFSKSDKMWLKIFLLDSWGIHCDGYFSRFLIPLVSFKSF